MTIEDRLSSLEARLDLLERQGPGPAPVAVEDVTEDDSDDDGATYRDYARCGCRFCFCMDETENGIVCESCLVGAHQG